MSHSVSLTSGAGPEISPLCWTVEPAVIVPVVAAATLYLRGSIPLAGRMPERFGAGRLIAVMAGLATVTLALSSLLDELGHQPASPPDGGRASAPVDGRPAGSDAARAAEAHSPEGGHRPGVESAPPADSRSRGPASELGCVRHCVLGVASPCALRSESAL